MTTIINLLRQLPASPGIYKMKDQGGKIIYVGKAKDLNKRVKTYFQKDYAHSARTKKLVATVADLEWIQTDTELEALILETNLIKELRPKYNILMKDDKSYVYIKINMGEDFPRISVVRQRDLMNRAVRSTKNVRYFGPKLASSKVYETLRILKKLFPFRHCKLEIKWKGSDAQKESKPEDVEVTNRVIDFPCLDYFIKRCPGPCIGAVVPNEYKKVVQQVADFLDGKNNELEMSLKNQMMEAATQKLFEKAAKIRDKLLAIETITERQKVEDPERKDTDIINFTTELGRIYFNILMIRGGKLLTQENFMMDALEIEQNAHMVDLGEVLESFITQYYEKAAYMPKEIFIPEHIEEKETLEQWLTNMRGDKVFIKNPERGEKNKLLELSLKNAVSFAKQYRIKWLADERGETALARLGEVLSMKEKPLKRIEGYDISHLGGNETVGSMVVFENGWAKSSDYRHFKMRTVVGKPDDYRSMEEVLRRRLKYLVKPKKFALRKAGKKYLSTIQKWAKEANWKEPIEQPDGKNFSLLFQEKIPMGMVRLVEFQKGLFEVSALFVPKEFRGHKLSFTLLNLLIAHVKNPKARFYVSVEPKLKDHYAEFGFTSVREVPASFKKRHEKWEKIDSKKYEVLAYYKTKKKKADPSFSAKPDLLVIDGGKGQLGTVVLVLKRLQLDIPVISLAKRLEEIYIPGEKAPLLLEDGDEALKLLQRIRDESHRFAITFQRSLHRKALIES